jgi:hypothetical protein
VWSVSSSRRTSQWIPRFFLLLFSLRPTRRLNGVFLSRELGACPGFGLVLVLFCLLKSPPARLPACPPLRVFR